VHCPGRLRRIRFVDYYRLDIIADAYTTGLMSEAQRQGVHRELSISGTSYTVTDLPEGSYTAMVQAVTTYGSLTAPDTETFTISAPEMPIRVSGLEIDDGADGESNGTAWGGKDCKIKWRLASVGYAYDIDDQEPQGAESGAPDLYLKDYLVQVYSSSGVLLRSAYVVDPWYVYTHEQNAQDSAKAGLAVQRTLGFKVYARGKQNQLSTQAAIL